MIATIMGVLEQALKLWNSHESTKYLDRLIKLKKEWYEEYNKPLDARSDVALDTIADELRILAESFISSAGSSDPKN